MRRDAVEVYYEDDSWIKVTQDHLQCQFLLLLRYQAMSYFSSPPQTPPTKLVCPIF